VMSTLGFGDITFHTDAGRLFSMLVLVSGIILLMIVLPFSFIRYFYAPWIEAQVRYKAPRRVPVGTRDHVIICNHDAIADALVPRLEAHGFDYVVIEEDPLEALNCHQDGLKVVTGDTDNIETWRNVNADRARMVISNLSDAGGTNATLTLREHAPDVPIAAIIDDVEAQDILEMSGANHAFPLKHQLGQQLAAHAGAGTVRAHRIGNIDSLVIAEFAVRRTALAGRTIRDSGLREATGLNVVAVRNRGRFQRAHPERELLADDLVVVVGTEEELTLLDEVFVVPEPSQAPILLIGGGRVGLAAARALKERGTEVHVVEQDPGLRAGLIEVADQVVIGNAAALEVMREAGIENAHSVLLTTHDDATNIFLTIYARRLNPTCHIVSRVTHERNLDAIHRAGANFVLSEASLGAKLMMSVLQDRELMVIGEQVEVFVRPLPAVLAGLSLADSQIGSLTGLVVIGIQRDGVTHGTPAATDPIEAGSSLVLLGARVQLQAFTARFER
jgi:voltage-gated potassium channel